MRAINIFLVLLFFSANALATPATDAKIYLVEMDIVLVDGLTVHDATPQNGAITETKITRLYKSKDSRIKNALTFAVKKNGNVLV